MYISWSIYKQKIFIILSVLFVFLPGISLTQESNPNNTSQALETQINEQIGGLADVAELGAVAPLQTTFAGLIQIFLGLLATIFFVLILMSGYWLITARGESEKYEKAMATLRRAVIGFVVIMGAYAITNYVVFIFTS